jgi:hypothetical protein
MASALAVALNLSPILDVDIPDDAIETMVPWDAIEAQTRPLPTLEEHDHHPD